MIILILFLVIFLIWCVEWKDRDPYSRTLEKDGYVVFDTPDIDRVLKTLPTGYKFLDYKYYINGCSLSTFHRDVTSSSYVFKTKHPVYTFIIYDYDGPMISMCPGSNRTAPFLWSLPRTIHGKKGTSILFDCDVVHAGCINTVGSKRKVRQYKVAHADDMIKLDSLQGLNTEKYGQCNVSKPYEVLSRKGSLFFAYVINHLMTPYLQKEHLDLSGKVALWLFGGRKFYNEAS